MNIRTVYLKNPLIFVSTNVFMFDLLYFIAIISLTTDLQLVLK